MTSNNQPKDDPAPGPSAREGRAILVSATFGVICVSAFTIIQYVLIIGLDRLPAQIVRFCLTVWLCWAVYTGSKVARTIAVMLCTLGAVGFSLLFITLDVDWLTGVSMIANAVSCAYYTFAIVASKDVKEFLRLQRLRREPPETLRSQRR